MSDTQWILIARFMVIVIRYIRLNAKVSGIDLLQSDIATTLDADYRKEAIQE